MTSCKRWFHFNSSIQNYMKSPEKIKRWIILPVVEISPSKRRRTEWIKRFPSPEVEVSSSGSGNAYERVSYADTCRTTERISRTRGQKVDKTIFLNWKSVQMRLKSLWFRINTRIISVIYSNCDFDAFLKLLVFFHAFARIGRSSSSLVFM